MPNFAAINARVSPDCTVYFPSAGRGIVEAGGTVVVMNEPSALVDGGGSAVGWVHGLHVVGTGGTVGGTVMMVPVVVGNVAAVLSRPMVGAGGTVVVVEPAVVGVL
jgi:hypothetical protein